MNKSFLEVGEGIFCSRDAGFFKEEMYASNF